MDEIKPAIGIVREETRRVIGFVRDEWKVLLFVAVLWLILLTVGRVPDKMSDLAWLEMAHGVR